MRSRYKNWRGGHVSTTPWIERRPPNHQSQCKRGESLPLSVPNYPYAPPVRPRLHVRTVVHRQKAAEERLLARDETCPGPLDLAPCRPSVRCAQMICAVRGNNVALFIDQPTQLAWPTTIPPSLSHFGYLVSACAACSSCSIAGRIELVFGWFSIAFPLLGWCVLGIFAIWSWVCSISSISLVCASWEDVEWHAIAMRRACAACVRVFVDLDCPSSCFLVFVFSRSLLCFCFTFRVCMRVWFLLWFGHKETLRSEARTGAPSVHTLLDPSWAWMNILRHRYTRRDFFLSFLCVFFAGPWESIFPLLFFHDRYDSCQDCFYLPCVCVCMIISWIFFFVFLVSCLCPLPLAVRSAALVYISRTSNVVRGNNLSLFFVALFCHS